MKKSRWTAAAVLGLAGMVLSGAGLVPASESQSASEEQVVEETGNSDLSVVSQDAIADEGQAEENAESETASDSATVQTVNKPEKDDEKSRTVSATATGVVMEVPDMAQITFGVVTNGEEADAAQSENTEKVNQVIGTLKGMGVEEKSIQTSGYSISPQYDYDNLDANKQPKLTGYEVRTTLQVSDQKIADAGKILSESVKAGVNDVESVVYTCSTYDEKYEEALQEAVEAARKKADVLAKAEGASAGKVVSISEGYQDLSARYQSSDIGAAYKETAAAAQDTILDPALSAGTLKISAEVSVTYELAY